MGERKVPVNFRGQLSGADAPSAYLRCVLVKIDARVAGIAHFLRPLATATCSRVIPPPPPSSSAAGVLVGAAAALPLSIVSYHVSIPHGFRVGLCLSSVIVGCVGFVLRSVLSVPMAGARLIGVC